MAIDYEYFRRLWAPRRAVGIADLRSMQVPTEDGGSIWVMEIMMDPEAARDKGVGLILPLRGTDGETPEELERQALEWLEGEPPQAWRVGGRDGEAERDETRA